MNTILENPIPMRGGINLPDNKAASFEKPLTKARLPKLLKLPLNQHNGLQANPVVKVGDRVFKGQLVAEAGNYGSASIHASTSGIVKEIANHYVPFVSSMKSDCIVIETDGEDKWFKNKKRIEDFTELTPLQVRHKIIQSGVDGLERIDLNSNIELLIINAAECEPYISCNEALIRNYVKDVINGIDILAYALEVNECVIAIAENKTETVTVIKEAIDQFSKIKIQLKLISSHYPANNEKLLIKSFTGIDAPAEDTPLDIGIFVNNVSAIYAIKKAIIDAEPLTSRIVTIAGSGIKQSRNMEVLLGTPVNEVIEQCGGYNDQFDYLIMGGPMTGIKLHTDQLPVIKTTDCLLALSKEINKANNQQTDCIRCDDCTPVCPVNLQPQQLHWHAKEKNTERLNDYKLFDCIECGCCDYVCPSHIPLAYEFIQAKRDILNEQRKQYEAEQNKKRYLKKIARLQKQEEDKLKKRKEKVLSHKDNALKKKQDAIAAAVKRVKKKREQKQG